jgi:hypothetical protein
MSLNILKKQVKYCYLDLEDEEIKMLKNKRHKDNKIKNKAKNDKTEKNLRFFELQDKYKTVSKNVMKYIKLNK